jgi:amino-acid N-acetyltransferase
MTDGSFTLRPATAQDAATIRALVRRVGINPLALNWRRFRVAVDEQGRLLGCGQIKPHADGTRELASIAVQPEYQHQGIGKALINALLAGLPLPIYLTCRASLGDYYRPFGFCVVQPAEMPPYFKRIWRAFNLLRRLFPRQMSELLVMVKQA